MRRYVLLPIGLFSLVLFVELGIIAKSGPLPIDSRVALWFKAHRTATEVRWAQIISAMSAPVIVFAVIILLLLFLNYWTRSWYPRDFIPIALVVTSAVLSTVAKTIFSRVRPGAGLTTLFDFEPGYPSSHVVFMAAALGSLLFFVGRHQFLILVGASFVTCVIGLVRLVLGVHWFTDIAGSIFLAFGVFMIFYVIDDWLAEKERKSL